MTKIRKIIFRKIKATVGQNIDNEIFAAREIATQIFIVVEFCIGYCLPCKNKESPLSVERTFCAKSLKDFRF